MTPGRDQIVLQASEALKEALGKYAQANGLSMAEVIRQSVADRIGYDLTAEPVRVGGGHRKYESPEARAKAALERAARRRKLQKEIQQAIDAGDFDTAKSLNEELKSVD